MMELYKVLQNILGIQNENMNENMNENRDENMNENMNENRIEIKNMFKEILAIKELLIKTNNRLDKCPFSRPI